MSERYLDKKTILIDQIQKYLKEHSIVDFDKLISTIKDRCSKASININNEGIKVVIQSLINSNYIVQGSKLTKDIVLNNPNRKKIYETIIENPGLYFNRLVKKLSLSNHVVGWHVNILLKFSFIKKERIDNHEVYVDPNLKFIDIKTCYILAKTKSQEIIAYLKNENNIGITKTHLSNTIRTHYKIISKYVDNLEEIGILRKEISPTKTLYLLNENYYNEILGKIKLYYNELMGNIEQ